MDLKLDTSPRRKKDRLQPMVTWSRLKLKWPAVIWLMAVVTAGLMFIRSTNFQTLTGMVQVSSHEVAPVEAARIQSIAVQVGQVVTQGQVLVVMDTRLMDAEMEVERIQIQRQFARLIQNHKESLREMKMELAQSQAELSVIAKETARLQELLDRGLVDPQAAVSVKVREEALDSIVRLYPDAIEDVSSQLKETLRQKQELLERLGGGSGPETGFLQLRRKAYTLTASQDGIVSRILKGVGEVVEAGEAVLTVVSPKPARVLGFLPEANVSDVHVGMSAVVQEIPAGQKYNAKVIALGPEVLPLPGRVSNIPGRTVRGLRVLFEPEEPFNLTPGVAVTIRIPEDQKAKP